METMANLIPIRQMRVAYLEATKKTTMSAIPRDEGGAEVVVELDAHTAQQVVAGIAQRYATDPGTTGVS